MLERAADLAAEPIAVDDAPLSVISASLRPRGPYSLRPSIRHGSDATRVVIDGVAGAVLASGGRRRARWQQAGRRRPAARPGRRRHRRLRFVLALDDDHSRVRAPLLRATRCSGRRTRALRGLRPLRLATVTQALLRALCGQLITARRGARDRAHGHPGGDAAARTRLHAPPTTARASPASRPPSCAGSASARPPRRARSSGSAARSTSSGCGAARPTRRRAARARARPRPVVGRRRLPRGPRPLRPRPRRRPRARQAALRAARPPGRRLGDRGAARAVRRVGRPRERVPAGRLREGPRAAAEPRPPPRLPRVDAATRRHPRRREDRRVAARRPAQLAAGASPTRSSSRAGARSGRTSSPSGYGVAGDALERRGGRRRRRSS